MAELGKLLRTKDIMKALVALFITLKFLPLVSSLPEYSAQPIFKYSCDFDFCLNGISVG